MQYATEEVTPIRYIATTFVADESMKAGPCTPVAERKMVAATMPKKGRMRGAIASSPKRRKCV